MDESEFFYPIAGVGMEYQGEMYVINSIDYDFEMVEGVEWTTDEWYNFRIEINPEELKYYFNDELVYTGENYNSVEIAGFNMLQDRKSTRLNSSHVAISYAVFCWKKKRNK